MLSWKKEFELGIRSIDEQHMELFNIGNRINEVIVNNNLGQDYNLDEKLDEFIIDIKNYTKYHFRTEEDLFLKYDYPNTMDHIKEHRQFIDFIDSLEYKQIHDTNDKIEELLNKIINWIFHHIITSDFLYKDYLIKKGLSEK